VLAKLPKRVQAKLREAGPEKKKRGTKRPR
jgi:hypothetical protein